MPPSFLKKSKHKRAPLRLNQNGADIFLSLAAGLSFLVRKETKELYLLQYNCKGHSFLNAFLAVVCSDSAVVGGNDNQPVLTFKGGSCFDFIDGLKGVSILGPEGFLVSGVVEAEALAVTCPVCGS